LLLAEVVLVMIHLVVEVQVVLEIYQYQWQVALLFP
jgi:hypothetical protein